MKKNIYLHLDLFSPTVYTKSPGDASPPPVFMIVQPYIFGDAALDCPDLMAYIKDIGQNLPADYRYIIMDENFEHAFGESYPVPFPFNAILSSDGQRINSMQNEMGYVFTTFKDQVTWMINTMSSVSITVEEYVTRSFLPFSDKDKEAWWNDLLAILTNYIIKKDNNFVSRMIGDTTIPVFADAMLQHKADPSGISLLDLLGMLEKKRLQKTDADAAIVIKPSHKENSFKNYAAALQLIHNDNDRRQLQNVLSLSSVTLTKLHLETLKNNATEDQLRSLFGDFKGYLRSLVFYFNNVFDKTEAGSAGTDQKKEALVNALHNYFYFGERTRIPALTNASFHILPLTDADAQEDLPLVTTPVISLSGQVINLSKAGALTIRSLNEAGNDPNTQVTVGSAMFADHLKLIQLNATDNNSNSFERSLSYVQRPQDEDWNGLLRTLNENLVLTPAQRSQIFDEIKSGYNNIGKASYLPSNSLSNKSELYQQLGAEELRFFSLPSYILDGLEEAGRVNYSDSFAQKNPARSAINYPNELSNYSITEIRDKATTNTINDYLKQFIPALLFKISAVQLQLPQKEKETSDDFAYKLSLKASGDGATGNFEQELIDYLFDPQFGPFLHAGDFNIALLADGKIIPEDIRPLSGAKKDSDELLELYITAKKGKITKEQYDLLIYPKDKDRFWQAGNAFYLNGFLFPHTDPVMAPLFIQNTYFNFKYHHSLNGLNTYVRLKLKPSAGFKESQLAGVETHGMQPVLDDHLNFNKFRLALKNGTADMIAVNKSDALRPVFEYLETSVDGKPSHNWSGIYKLLHRFSEELGSKGFGKSAIPPEYETEWNRYLLYRKCGTLYVLKGKPENQYALRLDTQDSAPLLLGNSGNVANLALLNIKDKAAGDKIVNIVALTCDYNRATKKIRLKLNKEYFTIIAGQSADKSRYRPVYEAMLELIQSEQTQLIVEGWKFDNTLFDLPLEQAVHPELANEIPSHSKYLRRVGPDVSIPITSFIADIKAKFDKDDIKQFEQAVTGFTGIVSADIDCPKSLESAEFLRVRLNIFRKKDNSVAAGFNGAVASDDIIPETWDSFKSSTPSVEYKVQLQTSMSDQARGQLSRIITPTVTIPGAGILPIGGDLFYSSAFITVENPAVQADKDLYGSLSLVLGENISFTAFNYSVTDPVPAGKIKKYADLFYIPYAVMPLKTIDELGSATESLLFAQYLMKILLALAYPVKAKENIDALIGNIEWKALGGSPAATDLLRANLDTMIAARKALNGIIAPKLAGMVTYVDDRDIEPKETQNDMGAAYKFLVQLYQTKNIDAELEKYFRSLFTAKPELFNTAKGFGVGLLQTVFTDGGVIRKLDFGSLYSMQVNKVINRKIKGLQVAKDPLVQVNNTFDFTSIYKLDKTGDYRAFVDILDDEMFDNEFEILPDIKNNKKSALQLKNHLRVAGDKPHNVYADSDDAGENINLVHYVDEWKDKKDPADIKQYYLLPSRRPPQRPVEQKVYQKVYYKNSDTTDVKNITAQIENILFAETDEMLKENHGTEYTTITANSARERVNKWTAQAGASGLKKGFASDASIVSLIPEHLALWKRYDKYVSVYTFSIEPDEEAADLSDPGTANQAPFKGFENDKLRLYFKLSENSSSQDDPNSLVAKRIDVEQFIALYESYKKRLRGENEKPTIDMSSVFDAKEPEKKLIKALTDILAPLHAQGAATVNSAFSDNIGVVNITDDGTKKAFRVNFNRTSGSNFTSLLGGLFYKDIFDNKGKPAARYFLSIAMLEDPRTHNKMRIQVDRNSRDFNHDGDPDINPRFEMFSEFSEWADHGHVPLDYNFWDGEGEDNKQLAAAYPPDLTRVKFERDVADAYEANLKTEKTVQGFYERAMRLSEGRFDRTMLQDAFMRVLISHRSTTNQIIELAKDLTPEFIDNFERGKIAYADEFIKQRIETDKCAAGVPLVISKEVTAMFPFVKLEFYDKNGGIKFLSINLQLQWEE